jgi:hypothetical protein
MEKYIQIRQALEALLPDLFCYEFYRERSEECIQLNLMPTDDLISNSLIKQKYDILIYRKNKFAAYSDTFRIKEEIKLTGFDTILFQQMPQYVGRTEDAYHVCSLEMTVFFKKGV